RTSGPGSPHVVCEVTHVSATQSCADTSLSASTTYGYEIIAFLNNWQTVPITKSATTSSAGVAPAITSANNTTFTVGVAGTFSVTTTGTPTVTTITNANFGVCTKSTLPGTLTFTDNGNGTATIAGTPASVGASPY